MPGLEQILLFSAASVVLIFTPGPDILYVLTRGVAQGRSAALAAAAGFSLGNLVHTFFAVVGLSAVLASSATAFQLVKWAGAAYLVYIGVQLFRSPSLADGPRGAAQERPLKLIFRQSVLANVLNPKVAIFFLAFFPQFVRPGAGPAALQMLCLGVLFVLLAFAGFATVAFASGAVNRWLAARPAVGARLNKAAGTVLVGLGVSLAVDGSR
ncbi:MAG: LysE family translocator [Desulfovibrionaceae bacterium]|jgi:threonine/homoserine/homoserine lactone efflux protein|nr:LysE family translocator [Desulfovibrionaceae bacterium]